MIPTDISNSIMDHLRSDTRSLKSCSLVARAWVPVTRFHLFSAMSICDRTRLQKINLFARLLRSRRSTIRPDVIRKLYLGITESLFPMTEVEGSGLSKLLVLLPSLDTLTVEQVILKLASMPRVAPSLKIPHLKLFLRNGTKKEISDMLVFFSQTSCDHLFLLDSPTMAVSRGQNFDIPDLDVLQPLKRWKVPSVTFLQPRTLRRPGTGGDIGERYKGIIYELLAFHDISFGVQRLALHISPAIAPTRAFVHSVRGTVQHLRVDVPSGLESYNFESLKPLRHFALLSSFDLFQSAQGFFTQRATLPANFLDILDNLPPTLRELTFSFGVSPNETLLQAWIGIVDWKVLQTKLLRLKDLITIDFVVDCQESIFTVEGARYAFSNALQMKVIGGLQYSAIVAKVHFPVTHVQRRA